MQQILVANHPLNKDLELSVDLMAANEYPEYFSIGICYREATGSGGRVNLYAANHCFDDDDYVKIGELEIDGADNMLDKYHLEVLQHPFSELYIKYTANSVSAGKLSIDLYKKDF